MNKELQLPTLLDTDLKKSEAREIVDERVEELAEYFHMIRASESHAVLIVLQGMDAAGKSGAIRNLFSHISPSHVRVKAFKKPTEEELAHDFLWRVHQAAPRKGEVVIFDRSHYEDILIQRVHNWIDMSQVRQRMDAINSFEKLLIQDNNTVIFKFFLNISYDQQEEELRERLDENDKHWKHNPGDWEERKYWKEYMEAYRYILDNSEVSWHVTPVDKRYHRDLFISKILLDKMKELNLEYPPLEEKIK